MAAALADSGKLCSLRIEDNFRTGVPQGGDQIPLMADARRIEDGTARRQVPRSVKVRELPVRLADAQEQRHG